MHEMFTHEWALAWREAIRASERYREAAREWRWPLVVTLWADAARGVAAERSVFLDLFEGDCREARAATPEDVENVPFILAADPGVWKQIYDRRLEPIPGVMRGKLKLVKGSLTKLLPHVNAARELALSASGVPTRFPDGL